MADEAGTDDGEGMADGVRTGADNGGTGEAGIGEGETEAAGVGVIDSTGVGEAAGLGNGEGETDGLDEGEAARVDCIGVGGSDSLGCDSLSEAEPMAIAPRVAPVTPAIAPSRRVLRLLNQPSEVESRSPRSPSEAARTVMGRVVAIPTIGVQRTVSS